MLEFISNLATFFEVIWNFTTAAFKTLIMVATAIPPWLVFLVTSIGMLPAFIAPFIIFGIVIGIAFFILGRS